MDLKKDLHYIPILLQQIYTRKTTEKRIYYLYKLTPGMNKTSKTHLIIHLFALAHALACLFLYNTAIGDAVVLTCLTIAMGVTLVRFYNGPVEVLVGLLLLSSFAGFFLGTNGAILIQRIFPEMEEVYTHVLTTTLVTEFLGWVLFFVLKRKKV